jgi:hypothetical protein
MWEWKWEGRNYTHVEDLHLPSIESEDKCLINTDVCRSLLREDLPLLFLSDLLLRGRIVACYQGIHVLYTTS